MNRVSWRCLTVCLSPARLLGCYSLESSRLGHSLTPLQAVSTVCSETQGPGNSASFCHNTGKYVKVSPFLRQSPEFIQLSRCQMRLNLFALVLLKLDTGCAAEGYSAVCRQTSPHTWRHCVCHARSLSLLQSHAESYVCARGWCPDWSTDTYQLCNVMR